VELFISGRDLPFLLFGSCSIHPIGGYNNLIDFIFLDKDFKTKFSFDQFSLFLLFVFNNHLILCHSAPDTYWHIAFNGLPKTQDTRSGYRRQPEGWALANGARLLLP
jgi:hypothetical protein